MVVRPSLLAKTWQAYNRLLTDHPWKTTIISAAVLRGSGDVICQLLIEKKNSLELNRTVRFFSLGMLLNGPCVHLWYQILDKYLREASYRALRMMALDQILFSPVIHLAFLSCNWALSGMSFEEIKEQLTDKYVDVMKMAYIVWPITQLINFYFVPLQYRLLVVQFISIWFTTYLAWKANRHTEFDNKLTKT